jgi:hypothetical protein
LDEVVTRFTAAVESAGDVVGQRKAALHDAVALPREGGGSLRHAL